MNRLAVCPWGLWRACVAVETEVNEEKGLLKKTFIWFKICVKRTVPLSRVVFRAFKIC